MKPQQETRYKTFCLHLTKEQADQIEQKAQQTRHKPSEIIYFIIADFLAGIIK